MLSRKEYLVSFELDNPHDFVAGLSSAPSSVMLMVRKFYEGKCYKGALILRVLEIVETSDVVYITSNTSGNATCDVRFAAEVEVFLPNSVMCGVRVFQKTPAILGVREYFTAPGSKSLAVVSFMATAANERYLAQLREGHLAPAVIQKATHSCMNSTASIHAELLTCAALPRDAFRLEGDLTRREAEAAGLPALLDRVRDELRLRAEAIEGAAGKHTEFMMFELLLYSYRLRPSVGAIQDQEIATPGMAVWRGPQGVAARDALGDTPKHRSAKDNNLLATVAKVLGADGAAPVAVKVAGYWTRPRHLFRSSPMGTVSPVPNQQWSILPENPARAFATMLSDILTHLAAVRELVETYNSDKLITDHRVIWVAMRSAQVDPPVKGAAEAETDGDTGAVQGDKGADDGGAGTAEV